MAENNKKKQKETSQKKNVSEKKTNTKTAIKKETMSNDKKTNKSKVTKTTSTQKEVVSNSKQMSKHQTVGAIANNTDEVTKLVETIFFVFVIFAAFYLITTWVTKNSNNGSNQNKDTEQDTVIQYDDILLGNVLKQNKDEYYVLLIDKKEDKSKYVTYISTYEEKEDGLKIYTTYLDDVFNQNYKSEESNLMIENIDDLKVRTTTLFKVKDHKVIEAIEENENVQNKLIEMTK